MSTRTNSRDAAGRTVPRTPWPMRGARILNIIGASHIGDSSGDTDGSPMGELSEEQAVAGAEGLTQGEVGGGSVMLDPVAVTFPVIKDAMVMRSRIGVKTRHCFQLGQSCTMSMWLWLKDPAAAKLVTPNEPHAEQSIVVVKGPTHTVSPHVLWGFNQAPGHMFCGLHTVSDNQMVGSFTAHPVPTEEWVHLALVFHATPVGPQRRFECIVNGRVQASVVVPDILRPLTPSDRSILIVGGSAQFHPAAPGIVSQAYMHHRQALDVASIARLMRAWPEHQRPTPRPSPPVPKPDDAVKGVQGAAAISGSTDGAAAGGGEGGGGLVDPNAKPVQSSGSTQPQTGAGNSAKAGTGPGQTLGPAGDAAAAEERAKMVVMASGEHDPLHPRDKATSALWLQLDEVLAGKDHAMMALGYKHLHGIDGVTASCSLAAAYYKGAADSAVRDMESTEGVQAEFVRLSHEIEKGNAFEGHKGEEDDVFRYQETMAAQGDTRAQAWLGHRYYWGAGGVARDRARALEFLQRAANDGNVEAQYNLGVMYAYGHGVEKDRNASLALFRKAADEGYTAAYNGLALSLTDGSSDNNWTEAFHYFNKSAAAGNADGLYNSALLLKDGRGTPKDEATAVLYMRRAVRADHQAARIALGSMLIEGRGVAGNCREGTLLLKQAAERGRWGILLRDGLEAYLRKDIAAAIRSYKAASELGYEVAQCNTAWLLQNLCPSATCGSSRREALDQAVRFLELAAANGNNEALRALGDAYWFGEGGTRDVEVALAHYEAAALAGDVQSSFNVAWALIVGPSLGMAYTATLQSLHLDTAARYFNRLMGGDSQQGEGGKGGGRRRVCVVDYWKGGGRKKGGGVRWCWGWNEILVGRWGYWRESWRGVRGLWRRRQRGSGGGSATSTMMSVSCL